jgi:gluconolactonase
MKSTFTIISLALSVFAFTAPFAQVQETYQLSADSQPQPGVPKGEVLKFVFENSKIFPGTTRDYWVYVPEQYAADKPACVYVNQDGIQYEAPTVFDNLINKKEMPVTIGVFVMHGRVKARDGNTALDRFNRSYEYDGLGDNYVRFLLEELLPDVETKKTSDGRPIHLSKNGNDRAIGGSSSGAICAFTAAWERPNQFSRVFSSIGTYVGLRGGDRYPTLIRKYEPKPIRVYLQDGSSDLNIYAGDWWMMNQTMERALVYSGYEVQHVWGEGAHNQKHATAVFPDAMRWLWKDWPRPVNAGQSRNQLLTDILIPGERWQLAGDGYGATEGAAANARGEVFFTDVESGKIFEVGLDGNVNVFVAASTGTSGAFGADGRLYAVGASGGKIIVYDGAGRAATVAKGFAGNGLVVGHNGSIYATNPPVPNSNDASKVWLIKPNGKMSVVDTGLGSATGVTLSPDQTLLYVADARSHWVYSYQVQPDGSLQSKQRYYWLHESDTTDGSGAGGMCVDRDGRLYVASRIGIQICDQAGRVNAIIPTPNDVVSTVTFGGANFDTLFVTSGSKVYKRRLKVSGALPWATPGKPAPPRL